MVVRNVTVIDRPDLEARSGSPKFVTLILCDLHETTVGRHDVLQPHWQCIMPQDVCCFIKCFIKCV